MIKSILTGIAACALLASPAAFAQSLGKDGEAAVGTEQINADGISLEFAPSGPNEFFIQGSPLTLSFAQAEAGKAQGLTVRENGTVIMQATAPR